MIKYFHELTEQEFRESIMGEFTWSQLAEQYPQPTWCAYPDATEGVMGCWSLMEFGTVNEKYCSGCECYKKDTASLSPGVLQARR